MSDALKLTTIDRNKIFRAVQEAKIPVEAFEAIDVTPENSQKYTSGSYKASFVIKLKNSPLEFWVAPQKRVEAEQKRTGTVKNAVPVFC